MWNLKKMGAVLAIIAVVIGLIALSFMRTPFMILKLTSAVLVLIFIALGWQYLE